MAPLPANGTHRLFFDYVTSDDPVLAKEHTFQVRVVAGGDSGIALQEVTDFLTALGPERFQTGWRVIRGRAQDAGAGFSFPFVVPPGIFTFVGTGGDADSPPATAIEYSFQGRSPTTGRRVDVSLYGMAGVPVSSAFRVEASNGVYPWLTAAVAALNASTTAFCTIDGSLAVWYTYLNWQYNSYWEERIRRG